MQSIGLQRVEHDWATEQQQWVSLPKYLNVDLGINLKFHWSLESLKSDAYFEEGEPINNRKREWVNRQEGFRVGFWNLEEIRHTDVPLMYCKRRPKNFSF